MYRMIYCLLKSLSSDTMSRDCRLRIPPLRRTTRGLGLPQLGLCEKKVGNLEFSLSLRRGYFISVTMQEATCALILFKGGGKKRREYWMERKKKDDRKGTSKRMRSLNPSAFAGRLCGAIG